MNKKSESNLRALGPLIDEFAEWYGDVLRRVFYYDAALPPLDMNVFVMFQKWRETVKLAELVEQEILGKVNALQGELRETSLQLCNEAATQRRRPDLDVFDKFANLFYSLIVNLRRIEKDSVLEDSGIDVLTGLRSRSMLHEDLGRELERLSRRGKPFCVALARIDHYEDIAAEHGRKVARDYTKTVSTFIKKSIRSFDDAYRLGSGEFLLSLKQADVTGGVAALERLKRMLEASSTRYRLNGTEYLLSMSCCIAEPLPEDDVDILIDNLRNDLSKVDREAGAVLEYHEMSDLQRYIQGQ